jgi:hypothetical protein
VKRPGMKLTTHLHLVPRSRMVDLYLHSPWRLHGVATSLLPYHMSLQKSSPVPWCMCFFAFCRHAEFNCFHISTFSPILVLFLILFVCLRFSQGTYKYIQPFVSYISFSQVQLQIIFTNYITIQRYIVSLWKHCSIN